MATFKRIALISHFVNVFLKFFQKKLTFWLNDVILLLVMLMTIYDRIKYLRENADMSQQELAEKVGFKTASAVNKIELGLRDINQTKILAFAKALGTTPGYLLGDDNDSYYSNLKNPDITEDVVTFPVIGEIAAGYDEIAVEDWSGDTVDIPTSYLKGRKKEDFFVLSVHGDSMYPMYLNGDKVLILKQNTLDHSGDVGAILYEGECATLKRVEYVQGEDWLRLVPINPEYQPKLIEGPDLELCRVIGVPRLLVREID